MKGHMHVFKIGGALINDANLLDSFLDAFCKVEGPKVLVHGGGRKATDISKKLGIAPKIIEGRRITDAATLEVVTMVYAGYISKSIVSKLQSKGCNAIGLCGADLGVIRAHKRNHPTIDYGYVGDIEEVNAVALINLLRIPATPVLCAISDNNQGQLLNTNADTIASQVAIALSENYFVSLHYIFEFSGVMKDINQADSLIPSITAKQFNELKEAGIIKDGMIPKIQNAVDAKIAGVHSVRICSIEGIPSGIGTSIVL